MTKKNGKRTANVEMSETFNSKKYGILLMATLPLVIESEKELQKMEAVVDGLLSKGENLSIEEEKLLILVSNLIEQYEDKEFAIPKSSPQEVLNHLIGENNLKQSDLLGIFGSSGIASEVISGKRGISKTHAKKLSEFFNVSAELFI